MNVMRTVSREREVDKSRGSSEKDERAGISIDIAAFKRAPLERKVMRIGVQRLCSAWRRRPEICQTNGEKKGDCATAALFPNDE